MAVAGPQYCAFWLESQTAEHSSNQDLKGDANSLGTGLNAEVEEISCSWPAGAVFMLAQLSSWKEKVLTAVLHKLRFMIKTRPTMAVTPPPYICMQPILLRPKILQIPKTPTPSNKEQAL